MDSPTVALRQTGSFSHLTVARQARPAALAAPARRPAPVRAMHHRRSPQNLNPDPDDCQSFDDGVAPSWSARSPRSEFGPPNVRSAESMFDAHRRQFQYQGVGRPDPTARRTGSGTSDARIAPVFTFRSVAIAPASGAMIEYEAAP